MGFFHFVEIISVETEIKKNVNQNLELLAQVPLKRDPQTLNRNLCVKQTFYQLREYFENTHYNAKTKQDILKPGFHMS